jgi:hypothetical protein
MGVDFSIIIILFHFFSFFWVCQKISFCCSFTYGFWCFAHMSLVITVPCSCFDADVGYGRMIVIYTAATFNNRFRSSGSVKQWAMCPCSLRDDINVHEACVHKHARSLCPGCKKPPPLFLLSQKRCWMLVHARGSTEEEAKGKWTYIDEAFWPVFFCEVAHIRSSAAKEDSTGKVRDHESINCPLTSLSQRCSNIIRSLSLSLDNDSFNFYRAPPVLLYSLSNIY